MQQKLLELDLDQTVIEEPTGLSSGNHASAVDLVKVLRAAAAYPDIAQVTTQSSDIVEVNGRQRQFRNTNGFVGKPGWGFCSQDGIHQRGGTLPCHAVGGGRPDSPRRVDGSTSHCGA
jgi:D-alanyl-D-alanine carboxypeptidase/D-alanyl-D-alanine endopeptidase (penicillin-binding protein 7)